LLVDADMRHPRQHILFNLENRAGLSTLLAGRADTEVVERILPLLNLSVLPAGPVPPNPQELLGRPMFQKLMVGMAKEYDVIILDTPAGNTHADAQTVAALAGGAFMVTRLDHTPISTVRALSDSLAGTTGAVLVGAIINKA